MRLRRTLSRTLIAATLSMTAALPSLAETYYVAPKTAAPVDSPDGSRAKPWSSVIGALKNAKGGDTILLMDGPHGSLNAYNVPFDTPVTVRSMNGKKARFDWITAHGTTKNIVFQNFSVWPSDANAPEKGKLIETGTGTGMVFDGLDVRGGADAGTYPGWSKEKWATRSVNGILTRGVHTTIKNNSFTGVAFGIQTFGDDSLILNNTVSGFSGDGMRVLGDNTVVRGNKVTDCVQINANHADGLQSWRTSGEAVSGLVIDSNTILEWSNPRSNPLRCKLQGIGFFDGFYDNLTISNNVISSSAYHGISVYGARNAAIVNNTVVQAHGNPARAPWIGVFAKKNGTPSSNVSVANNLSMAFKGVSSPANNIVSEANTVILYPAKVLQDVARFNYRPKADSGYIDSGSAAKAPKVDIVNNRRPAGKAPDRGAYEMNSSAAVPSDLAATSAGVQTPAAPAVTAQTAGKWLAPPPAP